MYDLDLNEVSAAGEGEGRRLGSRSIAAEWPRESRDASCESGESSRSLYSLSCSMRFPALPRRGAAPSRTAAGGRGGEGPACGSAASGAFQGEGNRTVIGRRESQLERTLRSISDQ